MVALGILALLVYTFGAYIYGAVLVLSILDLGSRGWAAQPRPGRPLTEAELAGGAMMALGFVWFVTNAWITIGELGYGSSHTWPGLLSAYCAFLYPPLIMHVTYAEHAADPAPGAPRPSAPWKWTMRLAYVVVLAVPVWATLALARVVPARHGSVNVVLGMALPLAFIGASAYAVAMSRRYSRPAVTPRERLGHRALSAMFGLTALLFVVLLALAFTADARPGAIAGRIVGLTARSLPLAFLFVGAYFESRFAFFDVLVKRGLSAFVTVVALAAFSYRILSHLGPGAAGPWIAAVALLPVVLLLGWVTKGLSSVLDRRWLGRRFSVVEAVKHVVATLRSATTEAELVELTERALGEIFDAPAAVRLGDCGRVTSFPARETVPIRTAAGVDGVIVMGPRASEAPYFSEDLVLLASLADVFAAVLDNLHLQERRREHEQRAQELSLHASRSELKALRAQINPHFLFNALNAIAGLIHRNPGGADRTIEQLADVFRYALRGSDSEWAVLEDEIEFVRAYLEVERARFGERLQVEIDVADSARLARIPTMVIQTLVENAVKHGLSELRGAALVRVEAVCEDSRLEVAVSDNGPGFSAGARARVEDRPRSAGYGLANIRQRLQGYFGAAGTLTIARDEPRGLTRVAVSMPPGGPP